MATAVTYSTTGRRGDLRTVIVDDLRESTLLLPTGRMEVMTAKAICGTTARCEFWTDELGAEYHDFAIPTEQVIQVRELTVATKVRRHK
jgi:hypothetical protein